MASFARWLRHHSEENLLAATQADLAMRYLGREGPVRRRVGGEFFWQHIFVPTYRKLPWPARRFVLHRMPGSHRRPWRWRT